MSTQSGMFRFGIKPPVLVQGGGGVWLGDPATGIARHPSGLAATWDGRLDNRDDLLMRLGAAAEDAPGDREIALDVFERWGVDGLRSLVGEWSLAIWDPRRRTLHLARDYMGVRPLYYCAAQDYVSWSSDLASLVDRTGRVDALSDVFAARYMSLRLASAITPYEGIAAVPSGSCISIDETGRTRCDRFWRLDAGTIRYADPRSYEEHLRALWTEAVGARLRTDRVVWAELSGGLDSSSVVCMADRLIRRGAVPAQGLRTVSHATLTSKDGDERPFIEEIERRTGVRSEIVGIEAHQDDVDPEWSWVSPFVVQGVGLETIRRVERGGGRIVLSGRLGDAVMGCQPDNSAAVFDDLAERRLFTAVANLRQWSRATRRPFVETAWRLFAPHNVIPKETAIELLTPALRSQLRDAPAPEMPAGVRRSTQSLARLVLSYARGQRLDVPHHSPHIVYTFPFAHRPLVEFVLAIPGEQLSAPGVTRSLMRRAFEHLVPPRVLRRISKGYYPPAAYRAARRLAAEMLRTADLEVVQRGWIDADRLRRAVRELTDGGGASGGDVYSVLHLERWLVARRDRIGIPHRKEVNSDEVLHA